MSWWRSHWPVVVDGLAAAGYLLAVAPAALVRSPLPTAVMVPLMLAVGAPLALRRRFPVPVLLTVAGASLIVAASGALADPMLAAAYALYPVATRTRRAWVPTAVTGTVAVAVLALGVAAGAPAGAASATARRYAMAALGVGLLAGSWTAGRMVRERRVQSDRWATELAGRAVVEERLRIARELHDVVAHGMSLIAVKAGTANHVLAQRPQEARDALRVIEATSRTALVEMRHLLRVLRRDTDPAELAPVPGLAGLPALAAAAAGAGLAVELDLPAMPEPPDGVGLTVYRIVQEALTNVVRHAGPTRCRVRVAGEPGEVTVEVTDDGPTDRPAAPVGPDGHGLLGMRERVAGYGGSLHAGRRPEGGYQVRARIPWTS